MIALSNPGEGAILDSRAVARIRINDNDKGPHFELASYSVMENAGAVVIRVVRGDDGDEPLTFEYATAYGTAVAGTDYEAARSAVHLKQHLERDWVVTDDEAAPG